MDIHISTFPNLIEKYHTPQILRCEKSHSSWMLFFMFFRRTKIWFIVFSPIEISVSATITCHKLTELSLVDCLINFKTIGHLWSCSIFYPFVGIYMRHQSRKQLLNFYAGFWLNSYTSSYLFQIKPPIFCSRFRKFFIDYSRKWSSKLFTIRGWYYIDIETINTSVKDVFRHKIITYFTKNFFKCCISSYIQNMSGQNILPNCQTFCPW